jgi:hypothetical protein
VTKFFAWVKQRSSPKDLLPIGIGGYLLKTGVDTGNELFVYISLYLFGLVPAWWGDGKAITDLPEPPSPPQPPSPGEQSPQ